MKEPKNILVRMPNWIGDLVMATPVLADLRKAFPQALITAMCSSPICELLKEDSSIDELFCFKRPSNKFERRQERRNIVAKIQAGKYDTGILLTNSFSSAWWFWLGGVKKRIGYSNHWRRFLLTDPIQVPSSKMHQVDLYKKLLASLGVSFSKTAPQLYVSEKEIQESKQLLYQRGYVAGKRLIGINPGAAYGEAKCWPLERFRALALELLKKEDIYLVFLGDKKSVSLIKEICQGLNPRAINLAGFTSLRELVCIIKECDLMVTNDSGPMHVADALGVPLIALFGSTDDEVTGPYSRKGTIIHKKVSCSPCMKRVCPIDFKCMKQISVEEVIEAVQMRLRRV